MVMVFRSCNGGITREIASDKDAFCITDSVIGVAGDIILRQRAKEDIPRQGACRFLTAGYLEGHRTVNTHHASPSHCVEQYSDIPMAYQPFGVLLKAFLWDTVQQMVRTIAAP